MKKPKSPKAAAVHTTTIMYDAETHRYYLDPAVPAMQFGEQLQINVDPTRRDRFYFLLVTITAQPGARPGSVNVHS